MLWSANSNHIKIKKWEYNDYDLLYTLSSNVLLSYILPMVTEVEANITDNTFL